MLFVCYPKCTTCQKARKWLDEQRIAYELRDIKTENPTYGELTAWYERSGLPLKKFFNTSGLLYKSMELKDKLPQMSEGTSRGFWKERKMPSLALLSAASSVMSFPSNRMLPCVAI